MTTQPGPAYKKMRDTLAFNNFAENLKPNSVSNHLENFELSNNILFNAGFPQVYYSLETNGTSRSDEA
jgi:hypothetical protein